LLVYLILQFYIPQKNRYGYLFALCTILTILWFFISSGILNLVNYGDAGADNILSGASLIRLSFGFLIIGCMVLVSVLWYTVMDQQEMMKRKSETEKLYREAELYKLRQQLQPHFLFNSLNSINALIGSQPERARTMIQQLSDFLRGTLKKEDHQWVSLDDELQHLHLYLDIEKVRFGHRLSTTILNETGQSKKFLPAMLLQPVVENAIKFGLYDTTEEIEIRIRAFDKEGNLVLEVENPFDIETSNPRKGTGFGLSSVERRLYLLFARNDLMKTEVRGPQFITTIKIPQLHDKDHNN
jgi:LytS/YehU family sensor histidine kinase